MAPEVANITLKSISLQHVLCQFNISKSTLLTVNPRDDRDRSGGVKSTGLHSILLTYWCSLYCLRILNIYFALLTGTSNRYIAYLKPL